MTSKICKLDLGTKCKDINKQKSFLFDHTILKGSMNFSLKIEMLSDLSFEAYSIH